MQSNVVESYAQVINNLRTLFAPYRVLAKLLDCGSPQPLSVCQAFVPMLRSGSGTFLRNSARRWKLIFRSGKAIALIFTVRDTGCAQRRDGVAGTKIALNRLLCRGETAAGLVGLSQRIAWPHLTTK
jgi:hypothetical protein